MERGEVDTGTPGSESSVLLPTSRIRSRSALRSALRSISTDRDDDR